MAGITLAQAETKLQQYLDAEEAILSNQSYSIDGRALTRADLDSVQKGVVLWNKRVQRLSRGGGIRVRGVTPVNG